jgi:hypothetical protein
MIQTSTKVSLTLVAAALLVVGWLSVISIEQQQAHASACNAFLTSSGLVTKTTGSDKNGPTSCILNGQGTDNFHEHTQHK